MHRVRKERGNEHHTERYDLRELRHNARTGRSAVRVQAQARARRVVVRLLRMRPAACGAPSARRVRVAVRRLVVVDVRLRAQLAPVVLALLVKVVRAQLREHLRIADVVTRERRAPHIVRRRPALSSALLPRHSARRGRRIRTLALLARAARLSR